jgi:hypothetical protein
VEVDAGDGLGIDVHAVDVVLLFNQKRRNSEFKSCRTACKAIQHFLKKFQVASSLILKCTTRLWYSGVQFASMVLPSEVDD